MQRVEQVLLGQVELLSAASVVHSSLAVHSKCRALSQMVVEQFADVPERVGGLFKQGDDPITYVVVPRASWGSTRRAVVTMSSMTGTHSLARLTANHSG